MHIMLTSVSICPKRSGNAAMALRSMASVPTSHRDQRNDDDVFGHALTA
jgi:hypothetical protein